jgi:oligoendopeptidase F
MTDKKLPHWDLSPLFPSLDSPEFQAAWTDLKRRLESLEPLLDRHEVGPRPARPSDRDAFKEITDAINGILEASVPIRAFVSGHVDTDSTNQAAQAKLSELQRMFLLFERLRPRLTLWPARLAPDKVAAGPTGSCWRRPASRPSTW